MKSLNLDTRYRLKKVMVLAGIALSMCSAAAHAQFQRVYSYYNDLPQSNESSFRVALPACKKNIKAWERYSPRDSQKNFKATTKQRAASRATFLVEKAVDIVWVDLNGDGWCDIITTNTKQVTLTPSPPEPPLMVVNADCNLFYDPTQKVFDFIAQHDNCQADEDARGAKSWYFNAVYFNHDTGKVERVSRSYRGSSMFGDSSGVLLYHARIMLRSMLQVQALCLAKKRAPIDGSCVRNEYSDEVEIMFKETLDKATADKMTAEEVARNGGVAALK